MGLLHMCLPAALSCLLLAAGPAGSAGDPPAELVAPFKVGSKVGPDHVIEDVRQESAGAILVQLSGPSGQVLVHFRRRDDSLPAFARTGRCDVVYRSSSPAGSRTPEGLDLAIQELVGAARLHDEACDGLLAPATGSTRPDPMQIPLGRTLPRALLVLLALGLAGAAATAAARRLEERHLTPIFWSAVGSFTVAALLLRLHGIDAPFCESATTYRIELASEPLWRLVTMTSNDFRHPPLAAILLHVALWFGRAEWIVRLPFVLASTLSVPMGARLGERLAGRQAGIAVAALLALYPPFIEHGQSVGSQALWLALAPCALCALWDQAQAPSKRGWVTLAVVNAACLWSSYLFVPVALAQLVLLAGSRTRGWSARCLGLTLVLGLVPLVGFARGFAGDMSVRDVSRAVPDAAWGDSTAGGVALEAVVEGGVAFVATLAILALAGTVLLVRRARPSRIAAVTVAAMAWVTPLAIVLATPLTRMRGRYVDVAMVLLAVLGVAGACLAGQGLPSGGRVRALVTAGLSWVAALVLPVLAVAPVLVAGPLALVAEHRVSDYPAIARHLISREPRPLVMVFGHSRTLVGYYLTSQTPRGGQSRDTWLYGRFELRALAPINDIETDYRERSELELAAMVSESPVWLVDVQGTERTWPGLEQAGGCRPELELETVRLLRCQGP